MKITVYSTFMDLYIIQIIRLSMLLGSLPFMELFYKYFYIGHYDVSFVARIAFTSFESRKKLFSH